MSLNSSAFLFAASMEIASLGGCKSAHIPEVTVAKPQPAVVPDQHPTPIDEVAQADKICKATLSVKEAERDQLRATLCIIRNGVKSSLQEMIDSRPSYDHLAPIQRVYLEDAISQHEKSYRRLSKGVVERDCKIAKVTGGECEVNAK